MGWSPPTFPGAFVVAWTLLGAVVGLLMLGPARRELRQATLAPTVATVSVITSAVAFALLALRFGPSVEIGPGSALAVVGPPLVVVDALERRLPFSLTVMGFVLAFGAAGVAVVTSEDLWPIGAAVTSGAVVGSAYLLLALLAAGGLGAGDVKFAALAGTVLGTTGWSGVLLASLITWLSAAVAALVVRTQRTGPSAVAVPLGPFLFLGTMVSVLGQYS